MGRSAYDFDYYARVDLRNYMKRFELPKPDLRDKSHESIFQLPAVDPRFTKSRENSKLDVQHERWRCLETMACFGSKSSQFDSSLLLKASVSGIDQYIPHRPILNYQERKESSPHCAIPSVLPPLYIESQVPLENLWAWLTLPLVTASRVLQVADPKLFENERIFPAANTSTNDRHLFGYKVWRPDPTSKSSVVIAYQTPHTLSPRELKEFVNCGAFPIYDSDLKHINNLQGKYRLWAKIWDTCKLENAKWFILTTYTHWIFGAFSPLARAAFISPVIPFDCKETTILEWIVYWFHSSGGNGFPLPKTYEPISMPYDVRIRTVNAQPPDAKSESLWTEPAVEEAIDVDMESDYASIASVTSGPTPESIQNWIANCSRGYDYHYKLDEDDLEFGPEPDELFQPGVPRGEWMI